MLPLMEMMLKTQNGEGFAQLSQQFGINSQQTEQALGAILPAFSTGLKRNASAPQDFGAFMQSLSGGHHEKYLDDTSAAFSDEGRREGNGILGHLFGSKQTSREIASHAAKASGVGESVIKKMLPVIASMVMGGISKQATGQREHFGLSDTQNNIPANALGGGILGQILGELVKGGITNQQGRGRPSGRNQRGNNPLGDILDQMMGNNRTSGNERPGNPTGQDNPLGKIFEDMLSGKNGNYRPQQEVDDNSQRQQNETYQDDDNGFEDIGSSQRYDQPRQEQRYDPRRRQPRSEPSARKPGGLEDLFGDMFETGRDVDTGYQRGVESIFDKFMKR